MCNTLESYLQRYPERQQPNLVTLVHFLGLENVFSKMVLHRITGAKWLIICLKYFQQWARSPDLSHLGYYLWGTIKNFIYISVPTAD